MKGPFVWGDKLKKKKMLAHKYFLDYLKNKESQYSLFLAFIEFATGNTSSKGPWDVINGWCPPSVGQSF
jgi:hypothetical protein